MPLSRKSAAERRAAARLRLVAQLLNTRGTAGVEAFLVAERRERTARQRAQREAAAHIPEELDLWRSA